MLPSQRSLRTDYLNGATELRPFYNYPLQALDWEEIIAKRQTAAVQREVLVEELLTQYTHLPLAEAARAQIQLLAQPTTFTITTGQQPGLYGGPLYSVYKTVSAIRWCRQLKALYPQFNFVPVFWMATEDHDYAEVNHCYPTFEDRWQYDGQFVGAVGRHLISQAITPLNAGAHALAAAAYQVGSLWGSAYQLLWHSLFGNYGLVVLNPDSAALKQLIKPLLVKELQENFSFTAASTQTEQLTAHGYPAQILPREINLFYLNANGRHRLAPQEAQFISLVDTDHKFSIPELLQEVEHHPERFSPNVVLRPVYQEAILPNLAYVGGWAEVSYWMQLKTVFESANVFYPAVIPRLSALLVPAAAAQQVQASGNQLSELTQPAHKLREQQVLRHWQPTMLQPAAASATQALQNLQQLVAPWDAGQARNVRGEQLRLERFFDRLQHKLIRSLAKAHPAWWAPLLQVKDRWQPDGQVQERVLNWQAFVNQGDDPVAWVEFLLAHLQEAEYQLQVLALLT